MEGGLILVVVRAELEWSGGKEEVTYETNTILMTRDKVEGGEQGNVVWRLTEGFSLSASS